MLRADALQVQVAAERERTSLVGQQVFEAGLQEGEGQPLEALLTEIVYLVLLRLAGFLLCSCCLLASRIVGLFVSA